MGLKIIYEIKIKNSFYISKVNFIIMKKYEMVLIFLDWTLFDTKTAQHQHDQCIYDTMKQTKLNRFDSAIKHPYQ